MEGKDQGKERERGWRGGNVPHSVSVGNKQLVLLIRCAVETIVEA